MKEKKKEKEQEEVIDLDELAGYHPPKEDSRVIVTTNAPRPPRKKRGILTTRDLPTELPNYHNIKKGEV
jgi:hypothetical protein